MSSTAIWLPHVRDFGTTTAGDIGLYNAARNVSASSTGGFYSMPLIVPIDFDRTRDAYLDLVLGKGTGIAPIVDQNVVIDCNFRILAPDQTAQTFTIKDVVVIPASTPNNTFLLHTVNTPNPTIPGHTIPDRSLLGFQVSRDGPNVLDTYTIALAILESVRLRYNRLCQFCDCPP